MLCPSCEVPPSIHSQPTVLAHTGTRILSWSRERGGQTSIYMSVARHGAWVGVCFLHIQEQGLPVLLQFLSCLCLLFQPPARPTPTPACPFTLGNRRLDWRHRTQSLPKLPAEQLQGLPHLSLESLFSLTTALEENTGNPHKLTLILVYSRLSMSALFCGWPAFPQVLPSLKKRNISLQTTIYTCHPSQYKGALQTACSENRERERESQSEVLEAHHLISRWW